MAAAANPGPRNIKQAEEPPKTLQIEVLSSHTKVSVTVDGTTVSSFHTHFKSKYARLLLVILLSSERCLTTKLLLYSYA